MPLQVVTAAKMKNCVWLRPEGHETPGSLYAPSTRLFPRYTKAYVYPTHFQTRPVNDAGDISWHKSTVFISEVFRGEDIGL